MRQPLVANGLHPLVMGAGRSVAAGRVGSCELAAGRTCNKDLSYFGGRKARKKEEMLLFAHLFHCPGSESVCHGEFLQSVAQSGSTFPTG